MGKDKRTEALRSGLARREALRWLGVSLAGVLLAALCVGPAHALDLTACGDSCVAIVSSGLCPSTAPIPPQALRAQCEAACQRCGGDVLPVGRPNANSNALICCPDLQRAVCVCGDVSGG
jgi:hypothetical protein